MSKENNINQEIPDELKNTKKSSDELNAESNTNIKKDVNDNNKAFKEKIDELKYFDAAAHFKENIIHFDRNCSDPIKKTSYYCFTCKHSVCNECGVFDHKEHLLIQRDNCLNYDDSFFNDISKVIEDGLNLDSKKSQIKKNISNSIIQLKEELDIIEKEKYKEIDQFFEEIKENYINLKKNFIKTKECIENYYNINKKFFNINVVSSNDKAHTEGNKADLADTIKKKKSGLNHVNTIDRYNYLKSNEIGDNKDLDNTIFIMNFELMNLCDNKNLQILDLSNEINNKIKNISNIITQTTNYIEEEFKTNYLNFKENSIIPKFDDFYWDIKIRCEKINENIDKFKETISDIYKRTGSFDKLKDLLSFFDSKNKKGKDVLFNQQFFLKSNDLPNLNSNMAKIISKKLNKSLGKVRSTSKNKFNGQYSQTGSTIRTKENANSKDKILLRNNQNGIDKYSKYGFKTMNSDSKLETKNNFITTLGKEPFNTLNNEILNQNLNKENIILNQRVLQRFFAYFVMDFFKKYFKLIKPSDLEKINESEDAENIYYQTSQGNQANQLKSGSKKKPGSKQQKNGAPLTKKHSKSVSLIANYTERYMNLKEKVKPIIGTNYIQFYDPATTKISKIQIMLQKDKHGYTVFPDGCRHILVENKLYITGGADNCGYPINIVLMFDVENGQIQKIGNLNDNHAYHTIEYLDNFDSLIVIGGENSASCEIMDLDSKKWNRLPSLNSARANTNIYYNNVTSDLFVLFGMEGKMDKNVKNTDVIEVLELNDIESGWIMVDYYKTIGLNLKISYCLTLPFTRDKLLIYGGSTARSLERRIFALFDMVKNEVIKVDPQTMDLIKLEENKIRSFDKALERIM